MAVFALALLVALLASASACSLSGDCSVCDSINSSWDVLDSTGPKAGTTNLLTAGKLSCYYGECKALTMGTNYEVFEELAPSFLNAVGHSAGSLKDCCVACRSDPDCKYMHFIPPGSLKTRFSPPGQNKCWHIKEKDADHHIQKVNSVTELLGAPKSMDHTTQLGLFKKNRPSWVIGMCNRTQTVFPSPPPPIGSINHDPHFLGGHGTKYDFNGRQSRSYCLSTDKNFAINALLDGYQVEKNALTPMGTRTWMKEMGFIWSANGQKHTVHMTAVQSKVATRGPTGFVASLASDGKSLPILSVGQTVSMDGGASLTFDKISKKGPFDVESYTLKVAEKVIEITVRAAHPDLRTPTDAEVHFSFTLAMGSFSEAVHGVLGQTFRQTQERTKRALKFSQLDALLHRNFHADVAEGMGFLDGTPDDYLTSSVLEPDCKFSAFSV